MSLESDSDNSEPFRPHTLPRYKSETTLVHSQSTRSDGELVRQSHAWRKGMPKVPKRRSLTELNTSVNEENPMSAVSDSEDKDLIVGSVTSSSLSLDDSAEKSQPRDDSPKVSRSSSAPMKQRPRPEVLVARSSSEPQGPKPLVRRISRELPVISKRLSSEGSVTSSSLSLDDSAVESATGSLSSLQTSTEISNSSIKECVCLEAYGEENAQVGCVSNFSAMGSDTQNLDVGQSETSSPEQEDAVAIDSEEIDRLTECSPLPQQELHEVTSDLQSLSESLESSTKVQGGAKQTPHIRSPLMTQQKIQSAINSTSPTDGQTRRASLPKRSSPVASRKPRPNSLVRNGKKASFENCESPDLSPSSPDSPRKSIEQLFEQNTASALVSREQLSKLKRPTKLSLKRSSEPVISSGGSSPGPVKPDRSHYQLGRESVSSEKSESENELATASSLEKSTEQEDELENGPRSAPATVKVPRKKSVSLMDLLGFGREVTNSREKAKGKENEASKEKQSSLENVNTSDVNDVLRRRSSETSVDSSDDKQTSKHRFRLRRSRSRNDLKDGIASGPNIDKRKASKLFLKESLLLESS